MAIDRSDFENVNEADIQALQQAGVPEGLVIEYKEASYGSADRDKREFLKDVSSFANTVGGHLLIGVAEKGGIPTAVPGLSSGGVDQELLRLESLAQSGIEPPIPLRMGRVPLANGQAVIIIRVPRSGAAPHRVIAQSSNRFWRRNSAGCYEPALEELRTMFNANAALSAQVRQFRKERIGLIQGNGLWRPLLANGQLVMHVIPVTSLVGQSPVDLSIIEKNKNLFAPLETGPTSEFRYNIDGALTERGRPEMAGYTQVFRNGIIESTKGNLLRNHPKLGLAVPAFATENASIATLRRPMRGLQLLNVPPPFVVGLSVIWCANAYYHAREVHFADDKPALIGRDPALLPDGQVDGYGGNNVVDAGLRPSFDALWNSAGYAGAEWFDHTGEWIQPKGA